MTLRRREENELYLLNLISRKCSVNHIEVDFKLQPESLGHKHEVRTDYRLNGRYDYAERLLKSD